MFPGLSLFGAAIALFPSPGARRVPPDFPLRVRLEGAAVPGATARIVDAATGDVVAAVGLNPQVAVETIGGLPGYHYHTAIEQDGVTTLFPPPHSFGYGKTYRVEMPGIADWTFATQAAPPPAGRPRLVVAADGTGDFCTVQGAVDFIPEGNRAPRTIFLRRGRYTEMVFFTGKDNLTFEGEDRRGTEIAYATNDRFNPSTGNPFAAGAPSPDRQTVRGGHIYHRGVFLAHHVRGLTLRHLTLRNTTPHGGSQAEAIILNGTPDAQARIEDVDMYSFQDTLQINGSALLRRCHFEGDVDFLWGTGPCFFEDCTIRSVRSGAYFTQVRNPESAHGFVFLRCTFAGAPGVTDNFLSRIQPVRFPGSEVVLIDCTLTEAVGRKAWFFQATDGQVGDTSRIRFWEAGSRTPDGRPVDASGRNPASRQYPSGTDPAIRSYRDPGYVLGQR